MSQRKLRDDFRDHYLEQELPSEILDRLVTMSETVSAPMEETDNTVGSVEQPARRPGSPLWVLAAAVLLVFGLWGWRSIGPDPSELLLQAVAEEIAMNHSKALAAEYATDSYGELRRQMDRLDFALVESPRLRDRGFELAGGRYCSIQGQLAAQLRLVGPEGEVVTLYQTLLLDPLTTLAGEETRSRGLQVELWNEDGVFLGLARSP